MAIVKYNPSKCCITICGVEYTDMELEDKEIIKFNGNIGDLARNIKTNTPVGIVTAVDGNKATVQIVGIVSLDPNEQNKPPGLFITCKIDKESIKNQGVDLKKYPHVCDYCGSPCWKGGNNSLDCSGCGND